ncbi:MAG TPA: phosphoribosylanthranilate isomerase [Vicinamibacterales bacterium]|nr:phosphoribosylanthranilate isomerase [Vicinamibacterales bacterium]
MTRLRIKLCGFTREEDIEALADADVDAAGFVLWHGSPRAVPLTRAVELARRLPAHVTPVGVMVRPTVGEAGMAVATIGLGELQLHGVDDPAPFFALGVPIVWVAPLVPGVAPVAPAGTLLMVDAHDPDRVGGTGRTVDWAQAADLARSSRLVLAGGLTPENVHRAVTRVRPYGIDVSSGIEVSPGVKSADRILRFVAAARQPLSETVR